MSDNNINVTAPLHAATKKGKLGAAKEIFLEGDTQTVEKEIQDINSRHNTLNTKHESLSKTVQGIAATGGASTATNVTYDNTNSGMSAENIQDAVDMLAKEKADSSDVTKQLDKVTIKDEDGTVVDTPFRYIQNEEFIFAKVDAEDKLLFGIQWDGTPKFGKTSEVEDELQKQITLLAERVAAIIGDDDITSTIDTLNELKTFFANIENTQSLTDILANLDNVAKNLDKTVIKDEEGNIQDTPFRVIENEEFIMAVVDSENRVLFGIYRATGKPYYPLNDMYHISQSEEFLWVILDAVNHPLLGIKEDGTCWAAKAQWLDDIKAIKEALSSIDETFKTFQPKEDGKGLINMEIADSFFYISNDEYIIAVVDTEDRILAGIKYDGQPYFPNREMYSVITNEEWLYAIIDAEEKILGGFRADDGHMIVGDIDISNFIANAIIDVADIKKRIAHISIIDNDEYLSIETDVEGKVIGYTTPDGSHYLYKVKSETIPEEFSHIEDPEERTEITTDSDDKVLSYRDSQGKKHEHDMEVTNLDVSNLDVSNLNLQGNSVNNIQDALKANGFDVKTPVDWSESSFIQIPEPRFAIINITNIDSMPTTKRDNKKAFLEFWDMQGNYFKKHAILNAQGNSSIIHKKKSIAVDFCEDEWVGDDTTSVKIGNWIVQDSFHLKAFYCSFYKNECPVSYRIWDRMCHTYKFTEDRPYKDYLAGKFPDKGANVTNSNFGQNNAFEARCVPDGFPCAVYLNNTFWGIYSFQLKKHRDNYFMDKESTTNIHLDGDSYVNLFNGIIDWKFMEIRNPKPKKWKLYDMDGNKYDGDSPKELMGKYLSDGETINQNYDENNESHKKSAEVKQNIVALSNYMKDLKIYENAYEEAVRNNLGKEEALATLKREIEKRFGVKWIMDYILIMCLLQDRDSINKNTQWTTWGAVDSLLRWNPNPYDMDGTFGCDSTVGFTNLSPFGITLGKDTNTPYSYIWKYYLDDMKKRYAELRQKGVFSYNVIFKEYLDWVNRVGSEYYKLEVKKWSESPSNRDSLLNTEWVLTGSSYLTYTDSATNWSNAKSYTKGKLIKFERKVYKSILDNNINHLPTDNNSEWWKLVSVQAKTYNAGDTVYDGYSNFFQFKVPVGKSITVTISEDSPRSDKLLNTPFTGFYEYYPHEGGRYDSIYRISKWIERTIELMDSQMEYNV
jgi:hypothetical protein